MKRFDKSAIFAQAWRFVKRNGFTMGEALKTAWLNAKLKLGMGGGVVKFCFTKVNGELREAYGTLKEALLPPTKGDDRKPNDTVQVYFDTEKQAWRSFKVANLVRIG